MSNLARTFVHQNACELGGGGGGGCQGHHLCHEYYQQNFNGLKIIIKIV